LEEINRDLREADFGAGTTCEEMRKIAQDESILLILAA
jgi:hypothetical protein